MDLPAIANTTKVEDNLSISPVILRAEAKNHDASNYPEFVKLKTKADAGDANAQFEIGYAYYSPSNEDKFNIARNYTLAHQYLEQSAKQGHAQAQYFMGHLYFYGDGVLPNYEKAEYWYQKSAQQGYQRASECLNELKRDGLRGSIEETEKRWATQKRFEQTLEKANKTHHAEDEFKVAEMYQKSLVFGWVDRESFGRDAVEIDDREAFNWYAKAAKQGYSKAWFALGSLYYNYYYFKEYHASFKEPAVLQEHLRQMKFFFEKAVSLDFTEAEFAVGYLNDEGLGGLTDKQKAFEYYQKAAKHGDSRAQYNLGLLYDKGEGVKTNKPLALYWYTQAMNNGDFDARYGLAHLYEEGIGIPKDEKKAMALYEELAYHAYGGSEARAVAQRYFNKKSIYPLKYIKGFYWTCYSYIAAFKIGPNNGGGIEKRTLIHRSTTLVK